MLAPPPSSYSFITCYTMNRLAFYSWQQQRLCRGQAEQAVTLTRCLAAVSKGELPVLPDLWYQLRCSISDQVALLGLYVAMAMPVLNRSSRLTILALHYAAAPAAAADPSLLVT
jgi:hypothetical protein